MRGKLAKEDVMGFAYATTSVYERNNHALSHDFASAHHRRLTGIGLTSGPTSEGSRVMQYP